MQTVQASAQPEPSEPESATQAPVTVNIVATETPGTVLSEPEAVAAASEPHHQQSVAVGVSVEVESPASVSAHESDAVAVQVNYSGTAAEVNIVLDRAPVANDHSETPEHVDVITTAVTEPASAQPTGTEATVISFDTPLEQDGNVQVATSASELDITAESTGETAAIEAIESVVVQVDADLEDIPPPPSVPAPSPPKPATASETAKKSGGLFGFLGKKKHKSDPATPASPSSAIHHDASAQPHVEPVPPPKALGIRARDMRMTDAQRIEIMTLVKGKQLTVNEAVERVLATEKLLAEVGTEFNSRPFTSLVV